MKLAKAGLLGGCKLALAAFILATAPAALADTPYDQLCDYLESNGNQAYDSGVNAASDVKMEIDMAWLKIDGDFQIVGSINSNVGIYSKLYFGVYRYQGNVDQTYCGYGNTTLYAMDGENKLAAVVGERVTYTVVLEKGLQELYKDGVRYMHETKNFAVDTLQNMYIFAYKNSSGNPSGKASARLYGLRIYTKQNGEYQLARDFKPAVKNGMGVLYDAVSDTIVNPVSGSAAAMVGTTPEAGAPDEILDWVETDGTQFVDTWLKTSGTISYELDMCVLSYPSAPADYAFLGAVGDNGQKSYLAHVYKGEASSRGASYWCGYGTGGGGYLTNGVGSTFYLLPGKRRVVRGHFEGGAHYIEVNGTRFDARDVNASTISIGYPLYIFAANVRGEAKYFSSIRLYGLTIAIDGTNVREFRPCRKNGRVGLYDAVGNTIYYPSAPFAKAPDSNAKPVKFLEYLETNKEQYIDTGVIGRSGTTLECVAAWLEDGDDVLCGVNNPALGNDARRFFLFARYVKDNFPQVYYAYGYLCWPSPQSPPTQALGVVYTNHVELAAGRQVFRVNGVTYDDKAQSATYNWGHPLYFFALNNVVDGVDTPKYHSSVRLYWAKIWQDGVLLRDYRPMLLSNGEVTLYDLCTQSYSSVFYPAYGAETYEYKTGTMILFR